MSRFPRKPLEKSSAWVLAALLSACASTGPAPVEERSLGTPRREPPRAEARPAAPAAARAYKVQRGDTLYSIAFRHGLDYRDLAGWNGIGAPYTIYVGQELRLAPKGSAVAASAPPPVRATPASPPVSASVHAAATTTAPVVPAPTPFEDVRAAPPAAAQPRPAETVAPVAPPPSPSVAATAPAPAAAPPPTVSPPPTTNVGDVAWRWPADGAVIGGFVAGDPTRQGIDLGGKSGDPVRAAADGSVVYSGNGLIGYGELIIVKHNASFLSAYGHNRKRLVKEGDAVKAGQVIAEMGSSSASRDSLHFEIRRNGKPVNPADFLPRR